MITKKMSHELQQKIITLVSKKSIFTFLLASVLFVSSCSKSDTNTTPTPGGGSTNKQYGTLTAKIDGRTFTSNLAYGIYSEINSGGTIIKSVAFGHNAAIADESIVLQYGSEVTAGSTFTFGKTSASASSLNQAIYKKPNTTTSSDAYLVSPLSSTTKCRFTYKIIRIFDNSLSTTGKSVEFDFSGVLYKGNNANDSVVITDGTIRY